MVLKPIRLLPPSVVQKIAAGEIIERPASVVKELVENSIDAGATRIEVRIADGGRSLIAVSDDGCGISGEEIALALTRHATSKIEKEDDLFDVQTLGFRGEALYSIAAVSHLDILTKSEQSSEGVRAHAEAGEVRSIEPYGTPQGTAVAVANLFYNVPARRKFLRSNATETSHIETVLRRIAMANTQTEILLESDGEMVFHLPATPDLAERLKQMYGPDAASHLLPVSGEAGGVSLRGYVSTSQLTFSRASEIWLYVNGRPVRDRMIQSAIMEGYRTALMERRYPFAILALTIDPHEVDVNVHPTKAEVRFADSQPIFQLVSKTIAKVLGEQAPTVLAGPSRQPEIAPTSTYAASTSGGLAQNVEFAFAGTAPAPYFAASPIPLIERGPFASLHYMGALDHTFLICMSDNALILIDQHAAHERVQFERLRLSSETSLPEQQRLLMPLTFEVTGERSVALESMLPFLERLGFAVEPFGPKTFVVKAVPAALGSIDPRPLLMDLADGGPVSEGSPHWTDRRDALLSSIACHSAVRAHDRLATEEVQALLDRMDHVNLSSYCPHGRPTFLRFAVSDLERLFKRK